MVTYTYEACFTCVYKKPLERTEPWQCPGCTLLHAVSCKPTRTNDPTTFDVYLCNQVEYIETARARADLPQWLADVMLDAVLRGHE